jgi:hypothetical protein
MVSQNRRPLWRRLLDGWMAIAARFGWVQTVVILSIFYVVLIGPVSLLHAVTRRDALDRSGLRSEGSAWHTSDSAGADLERAKLTS